MENATGGKFPPHMTGTLAEKPVGRDCRVCRSLALKKGAILSPDRRSQRKTLRKANKKTVRDFYRSWAWKKARYETLKKFGAACMCCGSREQIVVDHIKPRRLYPHLELDLDNLQVLCNDCNMGKSFDDETDWRVK